MLGPTLMWDRFLLGHPELFILGMVFNNPLVGIFMSQTLNSRGYST